MGFKPLDTLSTIGEEHPNLSNQTPDFGHFANPTMDDFAQWLPQNDFQFEPQLFGDYRDPQENVLTHGLDETFFDNALEADFITPYNLPLSAPAVPKPDLIAQIDAAKDADEPAAGSVSLRCDDVWEKIQNCPKARSGDFDLDGLCADLQKKAKCEGHGPVISEDDFQQAIRKHLCKDEATAAKIHAAATKVHSKTQTQTQS